RRRGDRGGGERPDAAASVTGARRDPVGPCGARAEQCGGQHGEDANATFLHASWLVGRSFIRTWGAETAPLGRLTCPFAGTTSGFEAETFDCVSARFAGPSQPALLLWAATVTCSSVRVIATP